MLHLLIVSQATLSAQALALSLRCEEVSIECIGAEQCVVEACCRNNYNLVIFLSLSPYFTSMNIVDHLRRALNPMPAIYVISHSYSSSTVLSLLECGVDQYMTFPVNLYRLRRKVYGLIERR